MPEDSPSHQTRKPGRIRRITSAAPRLRGVLVSAEEDVSPVIRGRFIEWGRLSPMGHAQWRVLDDRGERLRDGRQLVLLSIERTNPRAGPERMWSRGLRESLHRGEARIVIHSSSIWTAMFPITVCVIMFALMANAAWNAGAHPWNLGIPPLQTAAAILLFALIASVPLLLAWTFLNSGLARDRELRLESGTWTITDARGRTRTHPWTAASQLSRAALPMALRFTNGDEIRIRGPMNQHTAWMGRAVYEANKAAARPQPRNLGVRRLLAISLPILCMFAFCYWVLFDEFSPARKLLSIVLFTVACLGWPFFFIALVWIASRLPSDMVTAANAHRRARGRPALKARPGRALEVWRMVFGFPAPLRISTAPRSPHR